MVGHEVMPNTLGAYSIENMPKNGASYLIHITHHPPRGLVMSEENQETEVKETLPEESVQASQTESLKKKYRLITGESVLPNGEAKPSTLAFIGMYILGLIVFGVHFLFGNGVNASDDASMPLRIVSSLIALTGSESVPIGFVLVMGFITWANRMMNVSTSGRWVTIALLVITFMPVLIQIDDMVSYIMGAFSDGEVGDFIPFGYDYIIFGAIFTLLFWGATWKYQRSFSYAVTTNAVIFQHSFLLSRSHRRILFDRISEVMVERTPMGTMLGYATVTIMTDSGVGLVDETVGVNAGGNMPGTSDKSEDSTATKVRKGFLRSFFAFLSYQRTSRRVDPDPKHCFYKIRKWESTKLLLNEMHKKHSSSNLLEDLKEAISSDEK